MTHPPPTFPLRHTWTVFYRRQVRRNKARRATRVNSRKPRPLGPPNAQFSPRNRVIYGKLCDKSGSTAPKEHPTMGRPQKPLERDGTPVREFAFWLRDLRKRSGLTYAKLAKNAHYATSTVQEATAGRRFPTLKLTVAFVRACDGDVAGWQAYWGQIQRALDADAPDGWAASISPPWAIPPAAPPAGPAAPPLVLPAAPPVDDADDWIVESFTALLRLDTEPIEALEQRVIVAVADGLGELSTSISVPRHPTDSDQAHGLDSELLHGGSLELREQPYESYFKNVIVLPRPLRPGERHEYALRLRIPAGQPMATHYVYVPFRRSDHFELRVRFNPQHLPKAVWQLNGAPTAVIYDRAPISETLVPDRFGEVHVSFRALRLGLGYGLCWQE
jgi:transcriptional regulator with XRE-family HTH domain